jgi:GNAT superfamily N-acetyltransferase
MRIREAALGDSDRCAEIHGTARAEMPYVPTGLHTAEDMRAWMRGVVFAQQRVWVAEIEAGVVGYAALGSGFLNGLYVAPGYQGRGVGSALLQEVKAAAPEGFSLWTFQPNLGAIRFYRRHGFQTVRETDGAGNEERVPDRLMHWAPDGRQ